MVEFSVLYNSIAVFNVALILILLFIMVILFPGVVLLDEIIAYDIDSVSLSCVVFLHTPLISLFAIVTLNDGFAS